MLKNYSKRLQDYSNYYSRLERARGLVGHTPRVPIRGRMKTDSYQNSPVILPGLFRVILLGLLPCNRLGTHPLDYIKEGQVPSRTPYLNQHQAHDAVLDPQTGCWVRHLGGPNLYKSCVSCPCAYLQVLGLPITILTTQSTTSGTPLVGLPV
jgi:hypothetical protein